MREFKIDQDPYGVGRKIFQHRTVEFDTGVTVLIGCNGSGKTTLIHLIKDHLKEEHVPVLSFDNLRDGGTKSISDMLMAGEMEGIASAWSSSEGENIVLNLNRFSRKIGKFAETGTMDSTYSKLRKAMGDFEEEELKDDEVWIFFDAADSGMSIDNVQEFKDDCLRIIPLVFPNRDTYIMISANEYEMCIGEKCFDVQRGKYVSIKSYQKYKTTILKSRAYKDSLLERE